MKTESTTCMHITIISTFVLLLLTSFLVIANSNKYTVLSQHPPRRTGRCFLCPISCDKSDTFISTEWELYQKTPQPKGHQVPFVLRPRLLARRWSCWKSSTPFTNTSPGRQMSVPGWVGLVLFFFFVFFLRCWFVFSPGFMFLWFFLLGFWFLYDGVYFSVLFGSLMS